MKLLTEMARYHQHRNRYIYSGLYRFMLNIADTFKRYDPDAKVVDQGDEQIEVAMELTKEQARSLGAELEKHDDEWYAEFEDFAYGGYIQDDE